jgi:branched-chain amino acid transport system substrate-binding protein
VVGQETVRSGLTRRRVLAAGLLGTVAAATGACAHPSGTIPTRKLPSGEDLVFGACLELTGPGTVAGTAQQRAVKIAQDILNENGVTVGGTLRKVRVLVRDNASDPTTAAAIAQQFLAEKVSGIIGGGLANTSIAMVGVAEPHGIPMLSTADAGTVISPSANHRFIFKLGPNPSDVATLLLTGLRRDGQDGKAPPRIGVLAAAGDHGDAGVDAVRAALAGENRQLVSVERLPATAADFSGQATRIAATKPDAVVIWAVSPASGQAARALRAAGYGGRLLFDAGAASDDSLSPDNRSAMTDAYVVGPEIISGNPLAVNTPAGEAQQNFFNRYNRAYGGFSGLGVYAADALNLLAGAASRAGSGTPLRIRNELEASPFDGLAGVYVFSTANHGGLQPGGLSLFLLQGNGGWLQLA